MITITPPSTLLPEEANQLREVFRSAGYTAETLAARSGLLVPPPREVVPSETLAAFQDEADPLNLLGRMFFLGTRCEASAARESLSGDFIDICVRCGLLRELRDELEPQMLVVPVQDCLLASDLQLLASQDEAHFVPTLCDAALHLNLVRIQKPVDRVLDLCCGFGLHGLLASSTANEVIATDVNPRAEAFVRFNASLNGRDNITAMTGDVLSAVDDETFDLILCNPPFILSPESVTTYRFSPFELDGFVRELFSQVPNYLSEGGVMQAICEWVEIEGVDWQERLAGWFEDCGCDVWILPANRQLPSSYATTALRQTITDPSELARECGRWTAYFEAQKVEAIQGGFVFLRRRSGNNWIDFTQLTKPIRQPIGDAILRGFESRDVVFGGNDQEILQATPMLGTGMRMTEESRRKGPRWETESITLHLDEGLPVSIGMDQYVKNLIDRFDGQRTVADCLIAFSNDVGLPLETGFTQGLQIAKAMLRSDVLRLPETAVAAIADR
ncbi:MAG: class I SAM-dependent methyltransferase [Planctomycetota bacterium]